LLRRDVAASLGAWHSRSVLVRWSPVQAAVGRAICKQLAGRGARIVIADIDESGARETARMLGGVETHVLRVDVSRAKEVEELADESFAKLGGVDLVVNNAGVAVAGAVGEVPLPDWEWVVAVNLWGPIYGCHSFVPRLKKQGSGHILNVASAAGLLSSPQMAPYNVTKAGVVALSETLRAELVKEGIGVSVLCPTFFKTNIGKSSRGPEEMKALVEELLAAGKIQADGVAELALAGCDANELYITPHADGRWLWRMKRLMPERFYELMPKVVDWRMNRMKASAAKS
jgi:NAD(P)-dependent dehydrogenase (short-subunit alcohol dehydrogenase family)